MKKTIIIFGLLVLFSLSFGCLEKNNIINEDFIQPLEIYLYNQEAINYSGILYIYNNDQDYIFNKDFSIANNERIDFLNITNLEGIYELEINLNDNRSEKKEVRVGEYYSYVQVKIFKDKIEIIQSVE